VETGLFIKKGVVRDAVTCELLSPYVAPV
jgi:hypothetical protein